MRYLSLKHLHYPVLTIILGVALSFLTIGMRTGHAFANCGITSGRINDYAGVIVESRWYPSSGGDLESRDNLVHIKSVGDISTPPGGIVRLDESRPAGNQEADRRFEEDFYQIDSGCDDGRNVVLGRGQTSVTTDVNAWAWALDCDHSVRTNYNRPDGTPYPSQFQQFEVTGNGVPTGARGGGWWDAVQIAPANGNTDHIPIYYHEPPPPPPPTPPATGLILGYKVLMPGYDSSPDPPSGLTITTSYNNWTDNRNPYSFSGVAADDDGPSGPNRAYHQVTADVPPGWSVGHTVCYDDAVQAGTCSNSSQPIAGGNSVVVDVYVNNPVHVWWHYTPPLVTIKGRVFNWKNWNQPYSVPIQTCTSAGVVYPDGGGNFQFTIPEKSGFCVRAPPQTPGSVPANTIGPFVRPVSEGYGYPPSWFNCPGFTALTIAPMVDHGGSAGYRNYCTQGGYECQMSGGSYPNPYRDPSGGCLYYGADRNTNDGYDIVYVSDDAPTVSVSSDCAARTTTITASDPDGTPVPVRYGIDGPPSTLVWVNGTYVIKMPGSDPNYDYDNHTVNVNTKGRDPHGNEGTYSVNASTRYGNSLDANQACINRDFTAKAVAGPVSLLPDDETASSVKFESKAEVSIKQPGGPTQVNGIYFERRFFIRRPLAVPPGSVDIPLTSPLPSSPNPGLVNVPRSGGYVKIDTGPVLPPALLGDEICQTVKVRPTGDKIDTVGNIVPAVGNLKEDLTPPVCQRVIAKPYFRVYNSDVSAGFAASCSGWSATVAGGGKILGYNDGTGKGSGTQLAAFALNTINEFTSATGRTNPPVTPPKGLTFSNGGSGTYGTGFGAGFCPPDYYSAKPASAAPVGPSVDLASINGPNQRTGNVTINGGNIANATKTVLYVDGNVSITTDIVYTGAGSWSTITDIPNFTLVVKGNIYISDTVNRIDGFYIAQPNGATGGSIYTCAFGFSPPTTAQLANECRTKNPLPPPIGGQPNQLTINGAFLAKWVHLLRSGGSLKNSSNTENRNSTTFAEQFIFSPESWLSSALDTPNNGSESYDSISAVPPIL